ncbi:hypothetical protein [Microbacterium sp. BH-3-3-3]|uniref:hypothetical protein n=1 Tax=Microbacterium sp. BH-3-3-3 TaxID=1906742 RepID=UPI0016434D8E|nr:hypothetical protein [Microbacterium sp. BH-3-3-3]
MTTSTTPEPLAPVAQTPIARRTVLAGAAWSVPAIALTTASPAFAASGTTLSFAKSSYTGPGCSTINGIKVTASDNGTGQAGVSVTISLSGGFVFSNGGTTSTSVTGSDGSLTLPGITVPATGGTGTASASASGTSGSSTTLRGTDATVAKYLQNGAAQTASNIPTGSLPAFAGCYLAPDGRVLDAANNNTVLTSGVATFGQMYRDDDNWVVPLLKTDGSTGSLVSGRASYPSWQERTYPSVPSGSTPIVAEYFLTSDGSIVYGGNGVAQATNVASWGQMSTWGNQPQNAHNDARLPIKKTDGSFRIFKLQAEYATTGVPSGSTPAADAYFLAPDGRLVAGDDGSVLTTNVESFGRMLWDGSHWRWPLKKSDGSFTVIKDGAESAVTGIPSGSTPVVGGVFLAPDGRLIDSANSNTVYATAVSTTGQVLYYDWNGHWQMPLGIAETTPAYRDDNTQTNASGTPVNSAPVTFSWFVAPDGRLIDGVSGSVLASSVDTWGLIFRWTNNHSYLPLRKTDGTFTFLENGSETACTGVPSGSVPVAGSSFLSTDGRLIQGNTGIVEATNVASCGEIYLGTDGKTYLPLKKLDGTFAYRQDGTENPALGVPAGSRPIAYTWFLATDGRLIDGVTGAVLASNVDSVGRIFRWRNDHSYLPLKKQDGSFTYLDNGAETACQGIPSGSVPVAGSSFLAPNGQLIQGNTGSVEADNVHSCGQIYLNTDGHTFLPLAIKKTSC